MAKAPVTVKSAPAAKAARQPEMKPTIAAKAVRDPIPEGVAASTSISHIRPGVILSSYSLKLSASDPRRFQFETEFDFSQCTPEEILELALATVRIGIQSKLRAMGEGAIASPQPYKSVNVKTDYVNAARQKADEMTATVRTMVKNLGMSEDAAWKIVREHKKAE